MISKVLAALWVGVLGAVVGVLLIWALLQLPALHGDAFMLETSLVIYLWGNAAGWVIFGRHSPARTSPTRGAAVSLPGAAVGLATVWALLQVPTLRTFGFAAGCLLAIYAWGIAVGFWIFRLRRQAVAGTEREFAVSDHVGDLRNSLHDAAEQQLTHSARRRPLLVLFAAVQIPFLALAIYSFSVIMPNCGPRTTSTCTAVSRVGFDIGVTVAFLLVGAAVVGLVVGTCLAVRRLGSAEA